MPDSPYRQLVDAWLDRVCPSLPPGKIGLDVGGAHTRGRWRPLRRAQWVVVDIEGGPGVDEIHDVQKLPERWTETFDVVKATDTLYLVADPLLAEQECRRVLQPGGRLLITLPYLRPPTEPGDDWRAIRLDGQPLGGFYCLVLHLLWEKYHWLRPLVGRVAWVGRWLDGEGDRKYALGWAIEVRMTIGNSHTSVEARHAIDSAWIEEIKFDGNGVFLVPPAMAGLAKRLLDAHADRAMLMALLTEQKERDRKAYYDLNDVYAHDVEGLVKECEAARQRADAAEKRLREING